MLISSVKKITCIAFKFSSDLVRRHHYQHPKFAHPKLVLIPVTGNVLSKMCCTGDFSHSLITKTKFLKKQNIYTPFNNDFQHAANLEGKRKAMIASYSYAFPIR